MQTLSYVPQYADLGFYTLLMLACAMFAALFSVLALAVVNIQARNEARAYKLNAVVLTEETFPETTAENFVCHSG